MNESPLTQGMTLQVHVPAAEVDAARAFYGELFGQPPLFEPHDDFLEWAPVTGRECWFQVVGTADFEPLRNRVRFRVADIDRAHRHVEAIGRTPSEVSQLPGVVAFLDFEDPWGNQRGPSDLVLPDLTDVP